MREIRYGITMESSLSLVIKFSVSFLLMVLLEAVKYHAGVWSIDVAHIAFKSFHFFQTYQLTEKVDE